MEPRFVYITCGSPDEAQRIGRTLVEERLVACVNLLFGMQSMYWWEGAVQTDRETILIAKTTAKQVPALSERVKALHTYEVPCVVALPILDGNPEYLQWIGEETGKESPLD
jgi:periplasmic divalent cation tolerance protein